MLYSAKYNFLYSKTKKTASTSCEAALEYLIRGDFAPHATNSLLFEDGSRIGLRMMRGKKDPNFGTSRFSKNHQSLQLTRKQITPEKFGPSYKISSIRNPYDRTVSHFHFFKDKNKNRNNPIEEFTELKLCGRIDEIRRRFEDYLEYGPSQYTAREHWYIGPDMLIDKFVRMEYLREDLNDVLNYLNVSAEISDKLLSNIPRFKVSTRSDTCLSIADYFTDKTLEVVNERLSDWFSLGGYVKHKSIDSLESYQWNQ